MMIDTFALTATGVELATQCLTLDELVRLNLHAQNRWGNSKDLPFYGKVSGLFTENDGAEMHTDVLEALACVVLDRMGE